MYNANILISMKRILLTLGFILAMCSNWCMAQSDSTKMITKMKATEADYIALLNATGYATFSYDIMSLKDDTYNIYFYAYHYDKDSLISKDMLDHSKSRMMIEEFKKEDQERHRKKAVDPEHGVYTRYDKIMFGFSPVHDSICGLYLFGNNSPTYIHDPYKLRGAYDRKSQKQLYNYQLYPFEPSEIKEDTFIPLVAMVSFWFEEKYGIWRCCGKSVLSPDLHNDQLKRSTDYIIFGVEFHKMK